MCEYRLRLEWDKKEYLEKEVGSAVAPRAYAKQMLRRSGLSRFDQRSVLTACKAQWNADLIKVQLETVYKNVEGGDKHAVAKSKNF